MMRNAAVALVALLSAANGQAPAGRDSANTPPVLVWTGQGETGPDSATHDVFLSEDGRALVILVPGLGGGRTVTRVSLWNDVRPTVSQNIRMVAPDRRLYEYTVANSAGAADAIGTWLIIVPATFADGERIASPQGGKTWGGAAAIGATARQELLNSKEAGRVLRWYHHTPDSLIEPGQSVSGFGIESSLLPGFVTAWFGAGKLVAYRDSWPGRIFRQLEAYDDRKWRGKYALVIGPMFSPETPVSAIRENFVSGIKHLIESGRLDSKSAFVLELLSVLAEQDPARWKNPVISARPSTPLESEIAEAAGQSLGFRQK